MPEKPSAQPARPDRALEDELRRTRDELRQTRAQLEIARAEVARLTAGTAGAPPVGATDPKLQRAVQEQTEKLRALAATLALVEERERRALAQDLHDDLGQMIALIRLKASAMAALKLPAAHRKALAECTAAVDETHRRLRAMTFQLCPPMLHDMGLIPTLEWLADEIRHAYGLQVVVHDDGHPKPLDPSVTATLFRAVRELLINVARHAQVQAASVAVNLEKVNEGGEKLLITVSDAGTGFDPDTMAAQEGHRGFGLLSVRERLGFLGGSMQIISNPGDGTTVILGVPLLPSGSASTLSSTETPS